MYYTRLERALKTEQNDIFEVEKFLAFYIHLFEKKCGKYN